MVVVKHVSVTPKGGDVLEILKFFEKKAKAEDISLPEVEITSTELLEKFSKDALSQLISVRFLRVETK